MAIDRVTIEMTGGPGGNGIVTFYALDGAAAQPAVKDLASNWSGVLPNDIILNVPNSGDRINEETGELVGSWTGGTVGGFTGTDAGKWTAGVGMYITWRTSGVVAGRRVLGRTFIVPMGSGVFDVNGLPLATIVDAVGSWATDMINEVPGNFVIWSRPNGTRLGSDHVITSLNVPTTGTSLRTRRS